MKLMLTRSIATVCLALGLAALSAPHALAQGSGTTRTQVKMDRDIFLAMARWDESAGSWVLRDDMPMPAGVPSRTEVKAMRDRFLSMHTWDDSSSQYVPVKGAPRDMSKLSREQVKMETNRFLKMYRFDETTSDWVLRNR